MNEKQPAVWCGQVVPGKEKVRLIGSWPLGQLRGDWPVSGELEGVDTGETVGLPVRVAEAVAAADTLVEGVGTAEGDAEVETHEAISFSRWLCWSAMMTLPVASTATP